MQQKSLNLTILECKPLPQEESILHCPAFESNHIGM